MDIFWKPGEIGSPQGTIPASNFQNLHSRFDLALGKDPGKPSQGILRIQTVQADPGGDIGSILILVFQAFFHTSKVDQI